MKTKHTTDPAVALRSCKAARDRSRRTVADLTARTGSQRGSRQGLPGDARARRFDRSPPATMTPTPEAQRAMFERWYYGVGHQRYLAAIAARGGQPWTTDPEEAFALYRRRWQVAK